MQYNRSTGQMRPPDPTVILLEQLHESQRDQTNLLHSLSNAQGWIMARLHSADQFQAKVECRLMAIEKQLPTQNSGSMTAKMESMSGLLNAGRPYLVAALLLAGKWLGLGPSWIEPFMAKIVAAL